MVSPSLLTRCIETAFTLVDLPDGKAKHFAWLLHNNTVIGFGWNKHRSHPYQVRWGYRDRPYAIHAEAAAVLSTRKTGDEMIVVRVNRLGEVRLSKPCVCCYSFLQHYGVRRVWFTTNTSWERMEL